MSVIDLQQIAASLYNTVQDLNKTASELVGVDAIWCRLLPYDNGEDVIVQEYTLYGYECPKTLKVVINNNTYNVGNFSIDLFGIKSAETLEIGIDINTWKETYGENTMPQKGDFMLIPVLHRPYEVMSSTPVHTIGELITSWKCTLGEWKHAASRQESDEFRISIDEITNSQDRLFGKSISREVADAVVEAETAYNTTTYVDPYKDFDINSIIVKDLHGINGNIFSHAYYDFSKAEKDIYYKLDAIYDPMVDEKHWIYSCWFKECESSSVTGKLTINGIALKEKDYWYFDIISGINVNNGDNVTIYRGSQIQLNGIIEDNECGSGYTLKIKSSDCYAASKKVVDWWKSGIWKIETSRIYNLLSGYKDDANIFRIDMMKNNISFTVNGTSTNIQYQKPKISSQLLSWNYIAFDITSDNIRTFMIKNKESDKGYKEDIICDINTAINMSKTLEFDNFTIENAGKPCDMCNIRLYGNEYPLDENYKIDMYSATTRNASKLILVDNPNPANKMSFVSPIK
ncbi:MAG: hypothetical protein [Wendovervirus sonii]|uniref:Uncharacterized protein n=1 Tax=phage Lak_Megaphage_Sonny TaxID=3109229 RepID=A0ABZ0Z2X9_9CAUD|nr:MAG: hypothetical protein [phage Lak_Megaphage_Sonny]